jgi:hypothetical protein
VNGSADAPISAPVWIGNEGADCVSIARSTVPSGKSWFTATAAVRSDGWTGKVRVVFSQGELARFATEIRQLHTDLAGTARLEPREPNIDLTLTGDGMGHIRVDGTACNHFESGTKLSFRFQIDQTYLLNIADGLDRIDQQTE